MDNKVLLIWYGFRSNSSGGPGYLVVKILVKWDSADYLYGESSP